MSYFDRLEALKNSIVEKNNNLQAYANEASQNAEDTLKAKVQDVAEKLEAIGGTGFAAIRAGKQVKKLYDKYKAKREGKSEEETNEEPNTEEQDNTGESTLEQQGEGTPTSEAAQSTTENPQGAMEGEGEEALGGNEVEQVYIDNSDPFEGAFDRDVQVGGEWEHDPADLDETLERPVEVNLNDPAQVQKPESTNPAEPDAEPESVPDEAPAMGEEAEADTSPGITIGEGAEPYNPVAPGTSVEMEDASNFGAPRPTTLSQGELGETQIQQDIMDVDPESVQSAMTGLSTEAGEAGAEATAESVADIGSTAADALTGGAAALAGDAGGIMGAIGIGDAVLDAIPVVGEVALVATAIAGFFESLFGGGEAPDQSVEAKSGFDVNSLVQQTASSLQV